MLSGVWCPVDRDVEGMALVCSCLCLCGSGEGSVQSSWSVTGHTAYGEP